MPLMMTLSRFYRGTMRYLICLLAALTLMTAACGRGEETLTRMECVVNGEVTATLRFEQGDGRLQGAQLFDRNKQWLFTVQPYYSKAELSEVVYSSSEESQRAVYEQVSRDSLVAMFSGKGEFHTNALGLDTKQRVVRRNLQFRKRNLAYHIDMTWADDLPSCIRYTYDSVYRGREMSQGGELIFHSGQGKVRRIEVKDEALTGRGNVEIVCHYARVRGGGRHDWSEKAFYLPTPMLLLTAWTVHSAGETP